MVAVPDPRFSQIEKAAFVAEADLVLDSLWDFNGAPFGLNIDMKAIQAKSCTLLDEADE